MILIIEDDENINGLLRNILSRNGYEVQCALNGWEGYELAMKNDYSLILMDLMLPLKSGEEILRELRAKKNTPVIVLSAKMRSVTELNCLDLVRMILSASHLILMR